MTMLWVWVSKCDRNICWGAVRLYSKTYSLLNLVCEEISRLRFDLGTENNIRINIPKALIDSNELASCTLRTSVLSLTTYLRSKKVPLPSFDSLRWNVTAANHPDSRDLIGLFRYRIIIYFRSAYLIKCLGVKWFIAASDCSRQIVCN